MSDDKVTSSGLSLGTVLFLIFLVLKLTGTIDWSWWWVTLPLWGGLVLVVSIIIIAMIFAAIFG